MHILLILFLIHRMTAVDGPWLRTALPTTSSWTICTLMVVMPSFWIWGRRSPRTPPLRNSGLRVSLCSASLAHTFSVHICEWYDNVLCSHSLGGHTHFPVCCMFQCMTQSEYILCGITYWLTSMIASLISTVTWNSLLNYSSTFWALVHMQGCIEHCTWKGHSFH